VTTYSEFLETKRLTVPSVGVEVRPDQLCPALFPFQRDLTRWALRKGRAALFCYPGLGKTPMQLAWAQHAGERVLILAPLAVAQQTVREGEKFGIPVTYARRQSDATGQITVANYEMLDHFNPAAFDAVVLDESGILKSYSGAIRTALIEAFAETPLRLCCTATPAPNDTAELANHAEFLGLLTRPEMLATFFVHDEDGWRLKGHARQPFYRWLASWAMSLRRPSDLGYADDGYDLPPLEIESVIVSTDYAPPGQMFATALKGVGDRAAVRRDTLKERVAKAHEIILATWQSGAKATGLSTTKSTESKDSLNHSATSESTPQSEPNTTASGTTKTTPQSEQSNKRLANKTPRDSGRRGGLTIGEAPINTRTPHVQPNCHGSELISTCSSGCSNHKTASAQSAELFQVVEGDSISITTTNRGEFAEHCATPATHSWGHSTTTLLDSATRQNVYSERPPEWWQPRHTSKEQWVAWCGLNDEQNALAERLGDDCVSIDGALPWEEKIRRYERWQRGDVAVLVTKPSIFGWGLNMQFCHQMVFVGLSDSYEQYFQTIRRCYRFGQVRPVHAWIVLTDLEEAIYANVLRKETEAEATAAELVKHVAAFERAEIAAAGNRVEYRAGAPMELPSWAR
jgi:hypothetical protein